MNTNKLLARGDKLSAPRAVDRTMIDGGLCSLSAFTFDVNSHLRGAQLHSLIPEHT